MHGAVYGQNFGDVLIQALFYCCLAKASPLRVSLPFASTGFLRDFNETVMHIHGQAPVECKDLAFACWGPGGYFGERPFRKAEWHQRLRDFHGQFLAYLRRHALPSVVYGVGVGPLTDEKSRNFVRQCLDAASHVFVRDAQSHREAASLGVDAGKISITPDAIFLLRPEDIPAGVYEKYARMLAIGDGRKKIGLHLPDIAGESGSDMKAVVDCVETIGANYDATDFYLIADSPHQENKLAALRTRLGRMSNVSAVEYCGVIDLVGAISCLDTVVTTKLHVGLCSFALGHLPVSIYQHPKVLDQYQEAGIPEQCCPASEMNTEWFHTAFARAVNFRQGSLAAEMAARRDAAVRDAREIACMMSRP